MSNSSTQSNDKKDDNVDEFLLVEYSQIADSFLKSEELGETRVSFYIILATAITGGGVTLVNVEDFPNIHVLFILTSIILYFFGFLVLKRMIKRNISTDEYLRALSRIRNYFAFKNPEAIPHLLFSINDTKARKYTIYDIFGKDGGLVEMVNFFNSIIFGVICYLVLDLYNVKDTLIFSIVGVLISWILNFLYIRERYREESVKITPNFPPSDPVEVIHAAGGILWRDKSKNELLVIHRKRYDDWTLPKGKLMKRENWSDAALREVKEETGINAEFLDFAGCNCYEVEGVPKIVVFWNMAPINGAIFKSNTEGDRGLWLDIDKAVEKLQYPGEKKIIQKIQYNKNS